MLTVQSSYFVCLKVCLQLSLMGNASFSYLKTFHGRIFTVGVGYFNSVVGLFIILGLMTD
jgi:hypothetical protein